MVFEDPKIKLIRYISERGRGVARGECFFLFEPFCFYGSRGCFLAPASSLCAVRSIDLTCDVPSQVETLTVVG